MGVKSAHAGFVVGLTALGSAACGAAQQHDAPPVKIAEPQAARPTPADSAAPTAPRDDERARLEAACFAQPWTAAKPEIGPKPMSAVTRGRLDVLERECRDTHPELGPGRFVTPEAIPPAECHYGIGRIYFEERRYIEAARWFHRTATEDTDVDIGAFAAQLYLESLNVLWFQSEPKRQECKQLLLDDARHFACVFCASSGPEEQCTLFRRVSEEASPGSSADCSRTKSP